MSGATPPIHSQNPALYRTAPEEEDRIIEEVMGPSVAAAQNLALPLISQYKVGAVGVGKSGKVYMGANLEFPHSTLKESVHAEQSLIVLMRKANETGIERIELTAAPCGYCRQFLREIGDEALQIKFIIPGNPVLTLGELLPHSFGPKDLGKTGSLLVHPEPFKSDHPDSLVAKAIEAAHDSYCPYTQACAGIAIETSDGKIYCGSYLENAAHNPSMSPMQCALISLLADGRQYSSIVHVILVGKTGDVVDHSHSTQSILESIAPQAKYQFLTLEKLGSDY